MIIPGIESCTSSEKPAEPVHLAFNLQKGKSYRYETVSEITQSTNAGDARTSVRSNIVFTVIQEDSIVKTIKTEYKRLQVFTKIGDKELDIDTDKPFTDSTKDDIEMNEIASRVYYSMVRKPFIIKVNREGKVLEVDGLDIISDSLVSGVPSMLASSMKEQFDQRFSEQILRDELGNLFFIFPVKKVKPGDSWDKAYETGGQVAMHYAAQYTVKDILEDKVTLQSKTTLEGNNADVTVKGDRSGTMNIDVKNGLMLTGDFVTESRTRAAHATLKTKTVLNVKGMAL